MAQLTKGMFGTEFGKRSETALFDLRCGQIRSRDFVHNGGWYNRAGEKLGWGDLSLADFQKIAEDLEEGELFVILHESDSFWNFVERPGIIGSMAVVKPTVEAPGVEFVAEKAAYIIAPMECYYVDRYGSHKEIRTTIDGMPFTVLKADDVKTFITRQQAMA